MSMLRILLATAAVAVPTLAAGQAGDLSGAEIRNLIAGKRVYLATPFGGEFPLHYKADGSVDGSGEAIGLGRFMRPTDAGRWWIAGDRLCQKWISWYDGRQFCFTLRDRKDDRLSWTRDDGLSGRARVAE